MTAPATPQKRPRKAALASWIGSALEYYDFAVFGTAAALVLNRIFFPEDSDAAGILKSMMVLGVAYVVRPFGAMLMGPLGDRFGRRFVLMLTLFMMGGATFAIGCLPTYDQVGLLAPALLVLCRVFQGLSASGEQASAISMSLEHAHDHQRAFTTSWTLHGTQFGSLLATAVFLPFAALPEEDLLSWGWRVPFWLSAFVLVAAWLIRRRLEEAPSFVETQAQQVVDPSRRKAPLAVVFSRYKRAVAVVAVCAMVNTVNMVFTTFSISFATKGHGIDSGIMLWVPIASNGLSLLAIPLWATVADRVGRKPIFATGALVAGGLMFPYLNAITSGNVVLVFIFGVLMHGAFYSMANGIWPSFYAEMFPTRVRVTGLALGTQIGFALSGGIAPAAATALAGDDFGNWVGPAAFTLGMAALAATAALTARETGRLSLAEVDRVQER
ncbi:MFS transporter [Rothia nasimurium]|uniref:MFS transporter n=1 Tax=Rothia nasimurium TaxID=85336 RepID=UPI001F47FE6B|nr:MFS transporter [Rothia nasimurium]